MRIDFHGRIVDEPEIRAGAIGCGSHAFRNVYPVYQFAPVNLVATCDLVLEKAQAFARQFGAERSYTDYHEMLDKESLDAVFIVTKYDERGRPYYPDLAVDCLSAGRHVWIEKPPAATCRDVERMMAAAEANNRLVMVGMKKMFFPANQKAKELMDSEDFGRVTVATIRYPLTIPAEEDLRRYLEEEARVPEVVGFLDHLCHPTSLLLYLFGMPRHFYYERADGGGGAAVFTYDTGPVVTVVFSRGASVNAGMEHTFIAAENGRHIIVDNNLRVSYHRNPRIGYGDSPDFYVGDLDDAVAFWEPEFSLGQLYNKGLFLLGYYNEINEFARCILDSTAPTRGTLLDAWRTTHIFEKFAEGPGKRIPLCSAPGA